jgi:hypothetical protein
MQPVTRTSWLLPAASLVTLFMVAGTGHAQRKTKPSTAHPVPPQVSDTDQSALPALTIVAAVVCSEVKGYEDFEPLPDAALTSEEKLLVYYRPLHYLTDRTGSSNHIHLVQDGQIRRKGEKGILLTKSKMIDYDWKSQEQDNPVYMRSTYSLKGLKPGEYEFDIILHDLLAPGEPTVRQSLPFRVIPPGPRSGQDEPKK